MDDNNDEVADGSENGAGAGFRLDIAAGSEDNGYADDLSDECTTTGDANGDDCALAKLLP